MLRSVSTCSQPQLSFTGRVGSRVLLGYQSWFVFGDYRGAREVEEVEEERGKEGLVIALTWSCSIASGCDFAGLRYP